MSSTNSSLTKMKIIFLICLAVALSAGDQDDVLSDFSGGYRQFTANFYKELLKTQSGNLVVCPLSVNLILSLVYDGARGNTAQQLADALHVPQDKDKFYRVFRHVSSKLKGNEQYELTSANKLYLGKDFLVSDPFKNTAVSVFGADVQSVDFDKAEQAAAEINRWVSDKTQQKITNIVDKNSFNPDTAAVLVNAMYFHGKWVTKFKEEATAKKPFYVNRQKQLDVQMMQVTDNFNYAYNRELRAMFLEMPYQGGEVTMTFVLPDDVEGLPALEARLDEVLAATRYSHPKVHVEIPKFKIESTLRLVPVLKALGVVDAFENNANFDISAKNDLLRIDEVIQKAFIEVEEEGTTAAAATAVQVHYTRTGMHINPIQQFIADHPFIYYLKSSAGVLFIGRFVEG